MDDLSLLAVKAAMLKFAGPGRPAPFRSFADLAASPDAARLPPEPVTAVRAPGSTGRTLPQMLRSRGGRAGLGGLAFLTAGGLGAGLLGRAAPPPGVPTPAAEPPVPTVAAQANSREALRRSVASRLVGKAGDFWGRMRQRYTKPGPGVSEGEL